MSGLTVAVALVSALAFGQQDFPTLQGNDQRVGHNATPATDNPGQNLLNWFVPAPSTGVVDSIIRNNTSTAASFTAGWLNPIPGGEASSYYDATSTGNAGQDALIGVNPIPHYQFSFAVPSGTTGDPRVALNGYTAQVFSWTLAPATNTPKDYGLYVWLPIGPTVDSAGNYYYPPRYFVYEIDYGTGQTDIQVVDRFAAGYGWVRLGNGGAPTNQLYHYDGVNPITIKLFNTIPRDGNGVLSGVGVNPTTGLPTNQYVVYADAVRAQTDYGSYTATPVVGTNATGTDPIRVFAAVNQNVSVNQNGTNVTQQKGVLQSFRYNDGTLEWNFSPLDASNQYTQLVEGNSAVTAQAGWTLANAFTQHLGPQYYTVPVTATAASAVQVTYAPTLTNGSYDVYMWVPGVQTPGFAKNVTVEVDEGATVNTYTVDLTQTSGFVRLGGRRFANSAAEPLVVKITNLDTVAGDAGLNAFADAVRFEGGANLAVTTTPIYATVNINLAGTMTKKSVVVVGAEDGRIYCLDATGRGDGTTDVYWAYPSLPNPNISGYTDPNQVAGLDGVGGIAQMPTGFGPSSGLVEEVPPGSGKYYLYMPSTNGRVYCIDMAGRGDYNLATRQPGTTTRIWSFPNDYPSAAVASNLGAFQGSLAYDVVNGTPTLYVPTMQGRMYALNAAGDATTKTTSTVWTYPALTAPSLGPIATTPAIDGATPALYFGTMMKNGVEPGVFMSLDAGTGALRWSWNADPAGNSFSDFLGGAATAFNNLTGDGVNYVYASNQNGYVYAFNDQGAFQWTTNEIALNASAPLAFSDFDVYNTAGLIGTTVSPTVIVPTEGGAWYGLYADQTKNVVGGKLDWGYVADGDGISAGVALSHSYMYGGDNHGFLYAWNSVGGAGGVGGAPGAQVAPPNSPDAQAFRNLKTGFLTPAAYQALEKDAATGTPAYGTYTAPGEFLTRNTFDYGETMYVMVYDIPYTTSGGTVPPTITFSLTGNGSVRRTVPVQVQKFAGAPAGKEGYAILAYTIQGAGLNALTPGNGQVTFTIGAVASNGQAEQIISNPAAQNIVFNIANPIGIALRQDPTNALYGELDDSLGSSLAAFANPQNPENLTNGAPDVPLSTGLVPARLLTGTGLVNDGTTGTTTVSVYDRSLLALLNGPDLGGLNNVRVSMDDLAWQGGTASIINPLSALDSSLKGGVSASVLNGFEDLPVNDPNNSLDYPDLQRQDVQVIKEPNGVTENPLFTGVSLEMPRGLFVTDSNGNNTNTPVSPALLANRVPVPTPFEFDVNVPSYQPANMVTQADTLGNSLAAGYLGRANIFVDSNSSGQLVTSGATADAYRSLLLGTGVPVRESLQVITPNVDLGSIANGLGLLPSGPTGLNASTVFSPWGPTNQPTIYQSFQALNDSNVNLLNVRLAHQSDNGSGAFQPWELTAAGNDSMSYLDGSVYMWSDLDPVFSPTSSVFVNGNVFAMKPRITDRSGTQILTNPVRRQNANLGTDGLNDGALVNPITFPPQAPRIGVTPPIGFPTGTYSGQVYLIEDTNSNLSIDSGKTYSDPTLTLNFKVRETRLTNSSSNNTSPMADNLLPVGAATPFVDANVSPTGMRDLFGNLDFVWSSNRPNATTGVLPTATSYGYRLMLGSVVGIQPVNKSLSVSPLGDLAQFVGASPNQWFATAGPFPFAASSSNAALANGLFGVTGSNHIVGTLGGEPDSVTFGNAALPSAGQVNPFNSNQSFGQVLMAFTGTAQAQTGTGTVPVSQVFVVPITPQKGGPATANAGAIAALPDAPQTIKGKPSIVQFSNTTGVVFYTTTDSGRSTLKYALYNNGTFSQAVPIDLGAGFSKISDPSAIARLYKGFDPADVSQTGYLMELAFSAQLQGMPGPEIFMAKIPTDANGAPDAANSNKEVLSYFPVRFNEPLTSLPGQNGVYRAQGAQWNPNATIDIAVSANGAAPASIVTGTPVVDQQSGLMNLQTSLGTVYVNTQTGTVRFARTVPGANVEVFATYQPRLLRISNITGSGFVAPSFTFDDRAVGSSNYDPTTGTILDRYWYKGTNGASAVLTDPELLHSRYYAFYGRGAAGTGEAIRPMMQTLRFGITLPNKVVTLANGNVDFSQLSVSCKGPYQIDPANGRIYFTDTDEDNTVTVTQAGVTNQYRVTLLTEQPETPVPIDSGVNETGISAFIDPFDSNVVANRRPGLVWLLWSSTRHGAPDVYFETISPALYPVVSGQ